MIKKIISMFLLITLIFIGTVFGWTDIDKFMYFQETTETEEETQMVKHEVKKIVDELNIRNIDRYTQIQKINDWIRENVKYDDTNNMYLRSSYDALFEGRTVCTGYSMLFYRFMEELQVPCDIVSCYIKSSAIPHCINSVEMEDGYWYFVDATNVPSDAGLFLSGTKRANSNYYMNYNLNTYSDTTGNNLSDISYLERKYPSTQNQPTLNENTTIIQTILPVRTVKTIYNVKWGGTTPKNIGSQYNDSLYLNRDKFKIKYGVLFEDQGYLIGESEQIIKKGEQTEKITAIAKEGYRFLMWNDGKKNPTRYDRNIYQDKNYWALFERIDDEGWYSEEYMKRLREEF